MDVAALAGPSALVAAAATVVGAALLALFFAKGEPWGTLNDLASIVMMLATIPVAVWLIDIEAGVVAGGPEVAAAIGILGMVAAAAAQAALVLRLGTYRGLLPYTLGAGAVVGIWYILVGLLGIPSGLPLALDVLALAAGLGYVALGYGLWRGNERHPVSIAGGVVVLVASTAFQGWLGIALVATQALDT